MGPSYFITDNCYIWEDVYANTMCSWYIDIYVYIYIYETLAIIAFIIAFIPVLWTKNYLNIHFLYCLWKASVKEPRWPKWPPFRRRHFLEWQILYYYSNFIGLSLRVQIYNSFNNGLPIISSIVRFSFKISYVFRSVFDNFRLFCLELYLKQWQSIAI